MRKPRLLLIFVIALVLLTEAALQVRLFLQSRQGLIAIAQGKTKYINQKDGLKTLNPSYEAPGFAVNVLGIRSGPYSANDAPLLFMGASTVMGEFAKTNDARFSEIYARITNQTDIHVNAGIAGYRIKDQTLMLRRLETHFGSAKRIFIYPGFNDISDICSSGASKTPQKRAPSIELPEWTLVNKKIAGAFPYWPESRKPPHDLDTRAFFDRYTNDVRNYFLLASQATRKVVVIIPARSFTSSMPFEEKRRRASSILPFTPCLDVDQLIELIEQANDILRKQANDFKVTIIDSDHAMTGIAAYFVDATHFTPAGEQYMAQLLAMEIPR